MLGESAMASVVLGEDRQVRSLWNVLSQQAIGVRILATLPRAVRIGEIDLNVGLFGEDFVTVHLATLVVSPGLARRRPLAVEYAAKLSTRALVVALSTLASTTKPVVRSASVPT